MQKIGPASEAEKMDGNRPIINEGLLDKGHK